MMKTIGHTYCRSYGKSNRQTALSLLKNQRLLRHILKYVEGMQFDRGYITPYMVTDTEKMEAVLDDAIYPYHRQKNLKHSGTSSSA